ncbi:MAG: TIGR03960 family B12-binding radical SAM protein [Candidatus Sumerlaeia bacterium]|nr:TIGR03960 family B12-binding radical SAM protein [Candidatus Sumerlaeia bacterium]
MSLWPQLERILPRVEKPARYVGAEIGGVPLPPADSVRAAIALAFPDLYEIGASYHGFRILYERINTRAGFRAERAFAPADDFEREMRATGLPLYTLESFRPVRDFDLIGFSLQHELNYTNVLNMIDLAGLPLRAEARRAPWPLVIAGGEGALAPEPLAPFIDAFVLGDGEEVILEILQCVGELKQNPALEKDDVLSALGKLEGVYVPAKISFPSTSVRRRCFDLAGDDGPIRPLVPLSRIVHDRLVIEIRRGCARGCRFCSAGMTNRPVRERPLEQVLRIAEAGLAHTGYRDISLLSLSTGDYSQIGPLVRALVERFGRRFVSISLPSLRVSTFDVDLAREIGEVRKTGFTFAPEAGTERLRRVIGKPLSDAQFEEVVDAVCRAGWQTLKFYFMIGLPTETDADLDGIAAMVRRAEVIGRSSWKRRLAINVTVSPFVPKPHTPFQWEPQMPREELARRYARVEAALKTLRSVQIRRHSVETAFIEAVLARGDRRVADAIERAWQLGCRMDAWSDRFRFDLWLRAFEETGIDPAHYANRARDESEPLPWDHIDAGLSKELLRKWRNLAIAESDMSDGSEKSENSRGSRLSGQVEPPNPTGTRSAYSSRGTQMSFPTDTSGLSIPREPIPIRRGPSQAAQEQPPPVQRIRIHFAKDNRLRFLSHLDLVKTWQLLIDRAGLPMAYSRGFHPVALLQYAPPLPVGYASLRECVDLFLRERLAPEEVAARLRKAASPVLPVFDPVEIPLAAPALDRSIDAARYEIRFSDEFMNRTGLTPQSIRQDYGKLQPLGSQSPEAAEGASERPPAQIRDLWDSESSPAVLRLTVVKTEGNLPDPLRLLRDMLGVEIRSGEDALVTRQELVVRCPAFTPEPRARPVAPNGFGKKTARLRRNRRRA